MDLTPIDLARIEQLKQLGIIPPDPTIAPPGQPPAPVSAPYTQTAQRFLGQADQLEGQAAQPYQPMTGVNGALRALAEGFQGGFSNGPGYADREAQRQSMFRQQQQDKLSQVKTLRDEAAAQEQRGIQAEQEQRQEIRDKDIYDMTKQLRELELSRETRMQQSADAKNKLGFYKIGRDENGDPLDDSQLTPYDKAKMTHLQAQNDLADATADLKKLQAQGLQPGSPQFDLQVRKVKALEQNANTAAQNLGLRTQQFERDTYGTVNGTEVPGIQHDPTTGQPIGLAVARSMPKPTAQERNRQGQAALISQRADKLMAMIDQNSNAVGPIVGRLMRGEKVVGNIPPGAAALATELGSFAALQPILHGYRGGEQTQQHFEQVIGGLDLNPAALKASIAEIKDLAEDIKAGNRNVVPGAFADQADDYKSPVAPTPSRGNSAPGPVKVQKWTRGANGLPVKVQE